MTTALVPVKRLSMGKSRLHPELDRASIARLSLAMIEDVVTALRAVPVLDRIAIVTPDHAVAQLARAEGADVLVRPDPGLNACLHDTAHELLSGTNEPLLILMADVPGALSTDIHSLIYAGMNSGPECVALAPNRDGGTSALFRKPYNIIPSAFGEHSARRHCELASQADIPYRELALRSLSIDLDRPEDLKLFLEFSESGSRTRTVLTDLLQGTGN